jgi:hypothetical protein
MISRGATWTPRPGVRWFVRVAAIVVGLANLVGVILWLVGGLYVLGGESESSLREAVPSVTAAVVASLVTSQIVLRGFELPERGFWHRYGVVVMSVCIGGAIEGAMLAWVFSLDGTLFPEAPPGSPFFNPGGPLLLLAQLANVAWVLIGAGLVGAIMGVALGLAEGLVLGLPLAAVLGALRDN